MTEEPIPPAPRLPDGDLDPNLIYIAVGKSIHRWEGLEEALARLFLLFTNTPDLPFNYQAFGRDNGTFSRRIAALENAASSYFMFNPDQTSEGTFRDLVAEANDLSIERHRIAHGHITMWGEFKIPEVKGCFEVTSTMHYRWAPPFYAVEKLRTNPVGINGEAIDKMSQQFEDLHNRVYAFTESLLTKVIA